MVHLIQKNTPYLGVGLAYLRFGDQKLIDDDSLEEKLLGILVLGTSGDIWLPLLVSQ